MDFFTPEKLFVRQKTMDIKLTGCVKTDFKSGNHQFQTSVSPMNYLIYFLLLIGLMLKGAMLFAQPDGAKIFKQNCASCHTVTDAKLVGPGLKGITEKRSEEWLIKFIRDSQGLIKSGDKDAKAIFDEYNQMPMPPLNLPYDDIKAVLSFIASGGQAPKNATTESVAVNTVTESVPVASSTADRWIVYVLIALAVILFFVIYAVSTAMRAIKVSKGIISDEGSEPAFSVGDFLSKNKKLTALVTIIVVMLVLKGGWDSMMGIGIHTGYAPVQPIEFSHKVHAGQNGISCNYCHTGANKSKMAGIPSLNTCMNCHKFVQDGPLTGTTEIAKIYKALDYDPSTQKYGDNPSPIRWIRVHNLPDHAYFNHSQHVVAGKLECQTCHGPVQEMDVIQQHSLLTMSWCVDCHRNEEVKMEGSEYYSEIHNKYKDIYKGQKITVDKIGGLDCAKCHY
jgi:cytochrome c551/c552